MKLRIFLIAIAAFALAGCVSPPLLKKGEMAQIVSVTVTKANSDMGTENLAEAVRYKTLNAAYRFSEKGPGKIMELHITGLQISSPGMALLVSGDSSIGAAVKLTDKSTGKSEEPFPVFALIPRMGGIIGAIAAATVDPIQDEQRLTGMLAEQIMKRIYGEDYAETVASRTPAKQASPNYPVSYEEARRKYECAQIRSDMENDKLEAEARGESPTSQRTLPAHCNTSAPEKTS